MIRYDVTIGYCFEDNHVTICDCGLPHDVQTAASYMDRTKLLQSPTTARLLPPKKRAGERAWREHIAGVNLRQMSTPYESDCGTCHRDRMQEIHEEGVIGCFDNNAGSTYDHMMKESE
jgi:hypothetical protein